MSFLSSDCFYHNIPSKPLIGHDEIRTGLADFVGAASAIDWVLLNVAETADGRVLTERSDRFQIGGKWIEMPVMGIFELLGGKIAVWRDYYDEGQFARQMGRG